MLGEDTTDEQKKELDLIFGKLDPDEEEEDVFGLLSIPNSKQAEQPGVDLSEWTHKVNIVPILVKLCREEKFKRALRSHFLTHFTKNFCRFLTPKVKNGTDMINPLIESSDFLFWHQKI